MKSFPKFFIAFFLIVFILQLGLLLFLALAPNTSQAADSINFKPQVIQDLDYNFDSSDKTTGNIANLVRAIYKYAIGIVGILAAVVLMIGGLLWIVAGGSSAQIGEAKAWIGASLTGLLLALLSYLILATINPALVNLKTTGIAQVQKTGCCDKTKDNICGFVTKDDCLGGWFDDGSVCNNGKCEKNNLESLSQDTTNAKASIECTQGNLKGECKIACDERSEDKLGPCSDISGMANTKRFCCKKKAQTKMCEDPAVGGVCRSMGCLSSQGEVAMESYSCPIPASGERLTCCVKNTQATPANDYCIIKGSDCTNNGQSGYCDGSGNCLTANASGGEWCGKQDNFGVCTAPSYLMCPSGKSRVYSGRSCAASYVCCK